jgi:hypothetical protein
MMPKLAHTDSASPPWTQRPEGGRDVETLTYTTRARRGWQLRGGACSRLQQREVCPASSRAWGRGDLRLDDRVVPPSF